MEGMAFRHRCALGAPRDGDTGATEDRGCASPEEKEGRERGHEKEDEDGGYGTIEAEMQVYAKEGRWCMECKYRRGAGADIEWREGLREPSAPFVLRDELAAGPESPRMNRDPCGQRSDNAGSGDDAGGERKRDGHLLSRAEACGVVAISWGTLDFMCGAPCDFRGFNIPAQHNVIVKGETRCRWSTRVVRRFLDPLRPWSRGRRRRSPTPLASSQRGSSDDPARGCRSLD